MKEKSLKIIHWGTFVLLIIILLHVQIPVLTILTAPALPALCVQAFIHTTLANPAPSVKVYIIDPIAKQKILPSTPVNSFPILGGAGNNTIKMTACRDEFEPASFIIRSTENIKNTMINVTDLKGPDGNTIASSAVDIRVVKCWYQAGSTDIVKQKKVLLPELLLKDDTLVRVDEASETNYLKVSTNGSTRYIDISSPDARFPDNAEVYDAKTLQPFDAEINRNKQIWLTAHVPVEAKPGKYSGQILLKSSASIITSIPIVLTVLSFDLPKPMIDYGLYYNARLKEKVNRISSYYKNAVQYAQELRNMKDHGVLYPELKQDFDNMLGQALEIRKNIGLPTDKLYVSAINTENLAAYSSLDKLSAAVKKWKTFTVARGFGDLYIYGKDEAKGAALHAQHPAWRTMQQAGAKIFAACYEDASAISGNTLDLPILAGKYKPDEVKKWHRLGKKVFIYAYPQVGVESPAVYRQNYGIALVCNGYDGVMNFSYQYGFEYNGTSIWNDFDHKGKFAYRDHVFAYPTSEGVIDTIQWEGFREAVDDVRYLTAYLKATGASSLTPICNNSQAGNSPQFIKEIIINRLENRNN